MKGKNYLAWKFWAIMDRKWKLLERKTAFSSPFITLFQEKLRKSDGKIVENYFSVRRRDAVFIVPLTKGRQVLLVNQYKNGVKQVVWELPAGFIEQGEKPLEAAKRELLEETGFRAASYKSLGNFVPNMSISENRNFLFLAEEVEKVSKQKLDDNEDIEFSLFDLKELITRIKERKSFLIDTQSQLALLLTESELNKK